MVKVGEYYIFEYECSWEFEKITEIDPENYHFETTIVSGKRKGDETFCNFIDDNGNVDALPFPELLNILYESVNEQN